MLFRGSEKKDKLAKTARERGGGNEVYGKRAAHGQEGEASGNGTEGMHRGKGPTGRV